MQNRRVRYLGSLSKTERTCAADTIVLIFSLTQSETAKTSSADTIVLIFSLTHSEAAKTSSFT